MLQTMWASSFVHSTTWQSDVIENIEQKWQNKFHHFNKIMFKGFGSLGNKLTLARDDKIKIPLTGKNVNSSWKWFTANWKRPVPISILIYVG